MWYCDDKECEGFEKEVEVLTFDFAYLSKTERSKRVACPKCGKKMLFKDTTDYPNHASIMKFDSMNPTDKKALLSKRANKHFDKFTKDEVMYKKLSARENAKNKFGIC